MNLESITIDNAVPPLVYVDLDGTLIRSDMLLESAMRLAKDRPADLLCMPSWLARGKSALKQEISSRVSVDVRLLPYREDLLAFIRACRASGRRVVLATASIDAVARAVAEHLGCFDGVLATTEGNNLKGGRKLDAIQRDANGAPFAYIGDAAVDLEIWKHAAAAIVVGADRSLAIAAGKYTRVLAETDTRRTSPSTWARALRLHQWAKNALVFLPAFPILSSLVAPQFVAAFLAFVTFGLCASSVYIINDLLDLDADRAHPRKCRRPFASGQLSITSGIAVACILLAASFGLSLATLPWLSTAVLAIYFTLTSAYTFVLKRHVIVDVLALAMLYTIRVIAGAAAIQIVPSFWILAFSVFFFFSLATAKRYVEVSQLTLQNKVSAKGRGYQTRDEPVLLAMGVASGFASILVFAMYINDPAILGRYKHPQALWLLFPLVLYWMSRVWMKASRHELHDDPVVFALMDRNSRIVFVCAMVVIAVAIL